MRLLAALVNSKYWQALPTWAWERAAMVAVLSGIAYANGGGVLQWLSMAAVLLTFAHVQVSSRLEEADSRQDAPTVECRHKLSQYLVTKEVLWIAFFIATNAYPAVAGAFGLLIYPAWRHYYLQARAVQGTT